MQLVFKIKEEASFSTVGGHPMKRYPFFLKFLKQFMNFFGSKVVISRSIQCLYSRFGADTYAYLFISYSHVILQCCRNGEKFCVHGGLRICQGIILVVGFRM